MDTHESIFGSSFIISMFFLQPPENSTRFILDFQVIKYRFKKKHVSFCLLKATSLEKKGNKSKSDKFTRLTTENDSKLQKTVLYID